MVRRIRRSLSKRKNKTTMSLPKKLWNIILRIVLILLVLYMLLAAVMNILDAVQAKDYFILVNMVLGGVFVTVRFNLPVNNLPLNKSLSWIGLFSALILSNFLEYLFYSNLSDLEFCGLLVIILVLFVFSRRTTLWPRKNSDSNPNSL
jgi:hypothetical protein